MSGVGDWGFRGKGESERGAKREGGQRGERGTETGQEGGGARKERGLRKESRVLSRTTGWLTVLQSLMPFDSFSFIEPQV